MSIRTRLLLSYIAMLILPVILFVVAAGLLALVFIGDLKDIKSFYNLDFKHHQEFRDSMHEKASLLTELRINTATNPEKFNDLSYLQEVDKKLNTVQSGLLVRKNNQLIYVSPFLKDSQISSYLPPFGQFHNVEDRDQGIRIGDQFYNLYQMDFAFRDRGQGSLFVVTDASPLVELSRKFFPLLILALLFVLVLTNGLLTYLVSRSIIRPLHTLKKAAEQIKEGNLNFEVTNTSKDEIGQLSIAFEEMRRKLKESIEVQLQYEENRKELISNISHDLKTPVTAIKGYVEGIMDGVADTPEKSEKYIETIYRKANDLDRLIDELFLFSKLDLKKLPFHFEKVEITGYLEGLLEELQFDLEKQGIDIRFHRNTNQPICVWADREKLKRVITNVIDNSMKHMEKEQKQLDFTIKLEENKVLIEIRDNGQGIEPEALPFVFDRFYRADKSRNQRMGGSGLGLAIAKQIIEEHGGRIWAESRIGEGTSIFFVLPLLDDKAGEQL